MQLVKQFGETCWNRISKLLKKSEIKCHKRYLELSGKTDVAQANWSLEEDQLLTAVVTEVGAKRWTRIAINFPGRIGKQCRERWHHHLCPGVEKRKWTLNEDMLIIKLYM